MKLIEKITESGVVAVIRGATVSNIIPIAKALKEGGVITLEITMETPKVLQVFEALNDEFGDDVVIGAGTVLDPETARAAIMAGAKFIFSPSVNIETIKMAKRYGVISIPGALTPTEIITAYEHGADMIKVFPANVFGPSYLKDVHGPLAHIPLMPTGGIDIHNIGEFIKAGAVAAGVGSSLVSTKEEMTDAYVEQIRVKAQQFIQEVRKARK